MNIQADTSSQETDLPLGPLAYVPEIISFVVFGFSIIYALSVLYHGSYPKTIIYSFYAIYTAFTQLIFSDWLNFVVPIAILIGFVLVYFSIEKGTSALALSIAGVFLLGGGLFTPFVAPNAIDQDTISSHVYTLFYKTSLDGEFYSLYECDRISLFCSLVYRSSYSYFDKEPILVINTKNEAVSVVAEDQILYTYEPR